MENNGFIVIPQWKGGIKYDKSVEWT
jgi:hypothetical protein